MEEIMKNEKIISRDSIEVLASRLGNEFVNEFFHLEGEQAVAVDSTDYSQRVTDEQVADFHEKQDQDIDEAQKRISRTDYTEYTLETPKGYQFTLLLDNAAYKFHEKFAVPIGKESADAMTPEKIIAAIEEAGERIDMLRGTALSSEEGRMSQNEKPLIIIASPCTGTSVEEYAKVRTESHEGTEENVIVLGENFFSRPREGNEVGVADIRYVRERKSGKSEAEAIAARMTEILVHEYSHILHSMLQPKEFVACATASAVAPKEGESQYVSRKRAGSAAAVTSFCVDATREGTEAKAVLTAQRESFAEKVAAHRSIKKVGAPTQLRSSGISAAIGQRKVANQTIGDDVGPTSATYGAANYLELVAEELTLMSYYRQDERVITVGKKQESKAPQADSRVQHCHSHGRKAVGGELSWDKRVRAGGSGLGRQ